MAICVQYSTEQHYTYSVYVYTTLPKYARAYLGSVFVQCKRVLHRHAQYCVHCTYTTVQLRYCTVCCVHTARTCSETYFVRVDMSTRRVASTCRRAHETCSAQTCTIHVKYRTGTVLYVYVCTHCTVSCWTCFLCVRTRNTLPKHSFGHVLDTFWACFGVKHPIFPYNTRKQWFWTLFGLYTPENTCF